MSVGSPLINAPRIPTQGGTSYGVTPEAWQRMQQQHVPQQPVRPQPDPLMMFLEQQSQQNALMMQQMIQMTAAVVQALNGLSAGAPPGAGESGWFWWSGTEAHDDRFIHDRAEGACSVQCSICTWCK